MSTGPGTTGAPAGPTARGPVPASGHEAWAVTDAVHRALQALESAGVRYCLRNGVDGARPAPGEDVDVLVAPPDRGAVRAALAGAGWSLLRAPGHHGHEFWVRYERRTGWLKLDVVSVRRYAGSRLPVGPVLDRRVRGGDLWLAAPDDEAHHREQRAAGRRERPGRLERAQRALPLSVRRRGVVVAVLGPDGAGKGTIIEAVRESLPLAVSTVYLGEHRSTGSDAARTGSAGSAASAPQPPRSALREVVFLCRKWLRRQPTLLCAYSRAWRGHVVLCDRHPLDAVAIAPERTPAGRLVEQLLARRLTPRPDATVVLDAPGEVLWARKHEHSPAVLERWRQGYRRLPGASVVETTAGVPAATQQVNAILWQALAARRGW